MTLFDLQACFFVCFSVKSTLTTLRFSRVTSAWNVMLYDVVIAGGERREMDEMLVVPVLFLLIKISRL